MQYLQSLESSAAISVALSSSVVVPEFTVMGQVGIQSPPPARPVPAGSDMPPILVADDDPDDTFFIERLIKKTGVKNPVKIFDDGTEVVNYLGGARLELADGHQRCPRLLFLDLKMRGLGGFGFLEWARQRRDLGPLTIVVLSNSNEPEIVEKALALGAHRYLVKYPCAQTVNTIVRSVYPLRIF